VVVERAQRTEDGVQPRAIAGAGDDGVRAGSGTVVIDHIVTVQPREAGANADRPGSDRREEP
jgi:hypothetical protein